MNSNESKEFMIKDWHHFQHYKKGNKNFSDEMKWFKLYGRKLMQDKSYMSLDPNTRDTLHMLWMMASQRDGVLPEIEDIAFISRKDQADVNAHMEYFLERDIFIQPYDDQAYIDLYANEEILDEITGEYHGGFPTGSNEQLLALDNMHETDRVNWLQKAEKGTLSAVYDDNKTLMSKDDTKQFCKAYLDYKSKS